MNIMVYDPSAPKDRSKARPLSKEQFAVVHDYIIGCMNSGKKISEAFIIAAVERVGLPLFPSATATHKEEG